MLVCREREVMYVVEMDFVIRILLLQLIQQLQKNWKRFRRAITSEVRAHSKELAADL